MTQRAKRWLFFSLRWTVAVAGITWVVSQISLWDRVLILDPRTSRPVEATLAESAGEDARSYLILDPATHQTRRIARDQLLTRPGRSHVTIRTPQGERRAELLAIRPEPDSIRATELLIEHPETHQPVFIEPDAVVGGFRPRVPHPRVEVGLVPMIRQADARYLWFAVLIFPITFAVTSVRWHTLLRALDIRISLARTFVLNMVGAFYNSFMPGSTGGDLLKAYYAARHAPIYRTRAVMSVIVDRIIGLLTLVMLGGAMAALQWHIPACRAVTVAAAILLAAVVIALVVFYHPALRRFSGLEFLLNRLPMQRQVRKSIETMEIYRGRPGLMLWIIVFTFPVHITVIVSAMFAGMALGLPLEPAYYWVAVPVIVLTGAIPISPQGAGVMEFFAVILTRAQGASISEAFALAMSIRLVQVFWNLTGGIFFFRGGYHTPTPEEQEALDLTADSDPPSLTSAIGKA